MSTEFKKGDKVKCYGYGKSYNPEFTYYFSGQVGMILDDPDKTSHAVEVIRHDGVIKTHYFHPRQLEKVKEPREWYVVVSECGGFDLVQPIHNTVETLLSASPRSIRVREVLSDE